MKALCDYLAEVERKLPASTKPSKHVVGTPSLAEVVNTLQQGLYCDCAPRPATVNERTGAPEVDEDARPRERSPQSSPEPGERASTNPRVISRRGAARSTGKKTTKD